MKLKTNRKPIINFGSSERRRTGGNFTFLSLLGCSDCSAFQFLFQFQFAQLQINETHFKKSISNFYDAAFVWLMIVVVAYFLLIYCYYCCSLIIIALSYQQRQTVIDEYSNKKYKKKYCHENWKYIQFTCMHIYCTGSRVKCEMQTQTWFNKQKYRLFY